MIQSELKWKYWHLLQKCYLDVFGTQCLNIYVDKKDCLMILVINEDESEKFKPFSECIIAKLVTIKSKQKQPN